MAKPNYKSVDSSLKRTAIKMVKQAIKSGNGIVWVDKDDNGIKYNDKSDQWFEYKLDKKHNNVKDIVYKSDGLFESKLQEKTLSVPEKHQKKIALKTLKYSDAGASIMGGMTKDEARKFLKSIGYTDRQIKKLDESVEGKLRSIIRSAISEYLSEQEEESDNVDDEIDKTDIEEISATGGVAGYQTPAAFVGQGGKERKKKWLDKVNKIIGYEQVWDEEDADQLGTGAKKMSNYVGKNEGILKEANGHEVELFWKGLSGKDAKIGKFVVSPKTYDNIDTLFGHHLSIDLYDDKVSGKQTAFKDVVNAIKNTKYGKIASKKMGITDGILKEGRRGAYHEYRDDDSKTTRQKLGYSIREIRNQLREIEKKIDLNYKLKTETGIANADYWKGTRTALGRLAEIMNRLQHKIRRF